MQPLVLILHYPTFISVALSAIREKRSFLEIDFILVLHISLVSEGNFVYFWNYELMPYKKCAVLAAPIFLGRQIGLINSYKFENELNFPRALGRYATQLWNEFLEDPVSHEWRAMQYVVEGLREGWPSIRLYSRCSQINFTTPEIASYACYYFQPFLFQCLTEFIPGNILLCLLLWFRFTAKRAIHFWIIESWCALLPVTSENTDEEVPVADEDELLVSSVQGIYFPFQKLQPVLDHKWIYLTELGTGGPENSSRQVTPQTTSNRPQITVKTKSLANKDNMS
jgi:hypothetical protein